MKIQTFLNGKGIIHGRNTKRITCERNGVLKIGDTEIEVIHGGDSVMPLLFHGATGEYVATFTDVFGNVYDLGRLEIKNGRLTPPRPIDIELMEIRCKSDILETECKRLLERVEYLEGIFDTNSLNFLIGGEYK